jgi:predicted ribosomally synthesized peptide with SipW-like signal peptide
MCLNFNKFFLICLKLFQKTLVRLEGNENMKKIILSLAVLVLVGGGVFGVTRAYFSDTETSVGNVFTSGTLDLQIDSDSDGATFNWVDGAAVPVMNNISELSDAISKLKPGDSTTVIVGIKNNSTIEGLANIGIKNVVDYENVKLPQENGFDTTAGGELSGAVNLVISYGDKSEIGSEWDKWTDVWSGTLLDWKGFTGANKDASNGGASVVMTGSGADDDYWVLEFSIPASTGNEIMSDKVSFDIEFGLEQVVVTP